jgi:sulfite exporter TauE/SafE
MMIALTLGLISSWHCLGMCGPLFSALLFTSGDSKLNWINFITYHLSRIAVYGLIGFLPLVFGLNYIPVKVQQIVAIASGAIILIIAWTNSYQSISFLKGISGFTKKLSVKGFKSKAFYKYAVLGFSNGLLPCGMVYIALTAAIGTMDNFHPVLFMLMFGVGTIPVFGFLFSIRNTKMGNSAFSKLSRLKPYLLSFIAILLILRGLNLGIPLISPKIVEKENKTTVSCCHAPEH